MTPDRQVRWPDGSDHAVLVTVNYEDVEYLLAQDPDGTRRHKSQSVFQYGSVRGVPALLAAFAGADVAATWFVPGRLAETRAPQIRDIHAAGHEIAISGYAYEQLDEIPDAAQTEVLRRARDAVADVTGTPPAGFRLQRGDWPVGLSARLADLGFAWSSSLIGEDLPYLLPAGESRQLVELPRNYTCSDRLAFFWNFSPPFPPGQSRIGSYAGALENWRFELAAGRVERLCTVLELHPEVIGTPGRRGLLDELLTGEPLAARTWTPTGSALAHWWRRHQPNNAPSHPVEVLVASTHRTAL